LKLIEPFPARRVSGQRHLPDGLQSTAWELMLGID
jgi:hypothetical protein